MILVLRTEGELLMVQYLLITVKVGVRFQGLDERLQFKREVYVRSCKERRKMADMLTNLARKVSH
jgi:hypothetical protein